MYVSLSTRKRHIHKDINQRFSYYWNQRDFLYSFTSSRFLTSGQSSLERWFCVQEQYHTLFSLAAASLSTIPTQLVQPASHRKEVWVSPEVRCVQSASCSNNKTAAAHVSFWPSSFWWSWRFQTFTKLRSSFNWNTQSENRVILTILKNKKKKPKTKT